LAVSPARDLPLGRDAGGLTLVGDEPESAVVTFGRRMFVACGLAPDFGIDRWEARVAVDAAVNLGNDETRSQGQRLGVNLGAAGDDDGVRLPAPGVAAGRGKGGVDARGDDRARRGEFAVTAHHDGGASLERLADRKKSLAAHDDRLAHGERAEMLHVGPEPPRQRIATADDAVLGDGGDDEDGRPGGHRSEMVSRECRTAFSAEI
jgi:hypothetical protein